MRIHAASSSAAVTRTLEALILASGHALADAKNAELILVDALHPPSSLAASTTQWLLGSDSPAAKHAVALPAPFKPQQLKRLLAARLGAQSFPLGHGWSIDPLSRSILHADMSAIALTEKECALLKALCEAYPAALSRDALLADVWGITSAIDTHTLETHIYRLRHKFEGLTPTPCDIVTEGGSYLLKLA